MDSKEKLVQATAKLNAYLLELANEFQISEAELRQVAEFLTQVGLHDEFQQPCW